jgi:hypothetical protein
MMYEDAKMSKKHIYTAYSDVKGAFGGMDPRILFKTMRDLEFPEGYINTCEELYTVSGTYYMTPHGIPGIPPPYPSIEANYKETPSLPSYSRHSWNPYSAGSP